MRKRSSVLVLNGWCPICETGTRFRSEYEWYRDWLFCDSCGSIPRERALAVVLNGMRPKWRDHTIHESSPTPRGISNKLSSECSDYYGTHYFPDQPIGKSINGFQNENLEDLTFRDKRFDIMVTLDVMEHVNEPARVFQEAARTLKDNGIYVFTTPTYKGLERTERRARYHGNRIEHLTNEPEYHGNPISDEGSLVTFHFGYDLPELIFEWSGLRTRVYRFHDYYHGIIGEFTEVYVCCRG